MTENPSNISRRDFLNGVPVAIGATVLADGLLAQNSSPTAAEPFLAQGITQQDPRYYPPALTGMRGSHPGSFEVAHELRDGKHWDAEAQDADPGQEYDLIVVGAGISGLAAAYFYRKLNGPQSKILLLDNHDDFGGHAKRNEFQSGKHSLIGYGGTQEIEDSRNWSAHARGLLQELNVDINRFERFYDANFRPSWELRHAVFFDKETFGADQLVTGEGLPSWQEYAAKTPLSEQARKDLVRLQTERVDYLPGLTLDEKRKRLQKMSFKTFLLEYAKTDPQVVAYFQQFSHGHAGVGIEADAALILLLGAGNRYVYWGGPAGPSPIIAAGMGFDQPFEVPFYFYHFPDGNASIARLIVRSLVPGSAPGHGMEDIVSAKMDYTRLDQPSSPVRIRLNSTAVRAKHMGDPASARAVEVTYVFNGKPYKVRGTGCVMACYNMIVPYLCPELPDKQKKALESQVKVPLTYINVQIKDWKALHKLGVAHAYCPGAYFAEVYMDFPISMGEYRYTRTPDDPVVLHLVRTPCKPGLPAKEQHRAGRAELYSTPFATFERNIHDQLGRMFGPGGFDPARDVEAITVNRWPHGYADSFRTLEDPDYIPSERPYVVGRQRFGRITIANSDSAGAAQTQAAIDQGYRAVQELLS